MSQITHFCSVKILAWKSGSVKFWTNIMSVLTQKLPLLMYFTSYLGLYLYENLGVIFWQIYLDYRLQNLDYIWGKTSKEQDFPCCQCVQVKPSYLLLLSNSTITWKHEQQLLMVSDLQVYVLRNLVWMFHYIQTRFLKTLTCKLLIMSSW